MSQQAPRKTQSKKMPLILPDDPMPEAARQILHFHFLRMLHNEPGTRSGEDIEALHDMRVAVRRMRVAFEMFGGYFKRKLVKTVQKRLRRVTNVLGPVRDLDVFLEACTDMAEELPEAERDRFTEVSQALREKRRIARIGMIDFLEGQRYAKFVEQFQLFLETEGLGVRKSYMQNFGRVREVAPEMILHRLALVQEYDTLLGEATIKELHALRIAFKKLRYVIEFYRAVLGTESRQVINHLKKIQDHLGFLNDADVACSILQGMLSDSVEDETGLSKDLGMGLEQIYYILELKQQERNQCLLTFPEVWEDFNQPEFRQLLERAIIFP